MHFLSADAAQLVGIETLTLQLLVQVLDELATFRAAGLALQLAVW